MIFQSTLPVGGATLSQVERWLFPLISIHAPRGGSDRLRCVVVQINVISIHAPRGGSDPVPLFITAPSANFNPRSPWGERPHLLNQALQIVVFQSTLPVGGATRCWKWL